MRAILAAIRAGELDAEARLMVTNNPDSPAMAAAKAAGAPARCINAASEGGAEAADRAIAEAMAQAGVELIVLSGYLRPVGPVTLARYAGRILNVHPALLPQYGGRGLYGRRVHEAVHAAGDAVSGATIHLVDADYDTGPILAQQEIPIDPADSPQDIEQKVMALEPGLFVRTLQRIAAGDLVLPDRHL